MNDNFTKSVIQAGIDGLQDMIDYGEDVPADELHNRLYNEDYFIIGTYQAKEALKDYGTFEAIERVREYEKENFGEMTTPVDPESIANMLAYIIGEEALNEIDDFYTFEQLTVKDLRKIKKALEAQL